MKKLIISFSFLLFLSVVSSAQKGTAEPGYYPMNYSGDTWTGEVTSVDEETREFTLTYTKKEKTQIFVGILAKGYTTKMKDGSDYEIKMSNILGLKLTAYYTTKTTKDANGVKVKTMEVFKIRAHAKGK